MDDDPFFGHPCYNGCSPGIIHEFVTFDHLNIPTMWSIIYHVSTQIIRVLSLVDYGSQTRHNILGGTQIMKLNPLADNVLVKSALEEETTASGIILATATKEKSIVSEVVAVGPGTEEHPMTVKVGDKVIVAKFAGQELKLDNEDYSIVKVADILAVVE